MKIRKKKPIPKLNLNSVMDAIFIFIFFLLMSAQFINIYTINSEAPAVSLVKEDNPLKPLNLVLEIMPEKIVIKTGIDGDIQKSFDKQGETYPYVEIRNFIIELKKEHVDESSVTFKPEENIPYEEIVKIIDIVRELNDKEGKIIAKNKKGEVIETKSLFDQVIFETII